MHLTTCDSVAHLHYFTIVAADANQTIQPQISLSRNCPHLLLISCLSSSPPPSLGSAGSSIIDEIVWDYGEDLSGILCSHLTTFAYTHSSLLSSHIMWIISYCWTNLYSEIFLLFVSLRKKILDKGTQGLNMSIRLMLNLCVAFGACRICLNIRTNKATSYR